MAGSDSCYKGVPSTIGGVGRVLWGIGVPRTTVGRPRTGVTGEGLSTAPDINGPSKGIGIPRSAGARPRDKAETAGGCNPFMDAGVSAVRLGGDRLARESVLFVALHGDRLKATSRIAVTAAQNSATRSFRRSLQPVHSAVNFVGSLTLRNSTSGKSCLQARQWRTVWGMSSSI